MVDFWNVSRRRGLPGPHPELHRRSAGSHYKRPSRTTFEAKPCEEAGRRWRITLVYRDIVAWLVSGSPTIPTETPGQTLAASSMAGSTMNAKSIRSTLEAYYGLICIRLAGEDLLESQSQILRQRNGAQQMS